MSGKKRNTLNGVRLEAIEFIIGIILLIGFFAPWGGSQMDTLHGLEFGPAKLSFLGAWLVVISALLDYHAFNSETLDKARPIIDAGLGTLGGIFCLAGAFFVLSDMPRLVSPSWGLYLVIVMSFLAIFTAVKPYSDIEIPFIE